MTNLLTIVFVSCPVQKLWSSDYVDICANIYVRTYSNMCVITYIYMYICTYIIMQYVCQELAWAIETASAYYQYNIICDPAWENRAYVHTKFDHFFRIWSFITLWLNMHINDTFSNIAANNVLNNAVDKTIIPVTAGEISRIMWSGVFCVRKPYFLMPGHI